MTHSEASLVGYLSACPMTYGQRAMGKAMHGPTLGTSGEDGGDIHGCHHGLSQGQWAALVRTLWSPTEHSLQPIPWALQPTHWPKAW